MHRDALEKIKNVLIVVVIDENLSSEIISAFLDLIICVFLLNPKTLLKFEETKIFRIVVVVVTFQNERRLQNKTEEEEEEEEEINAEAANQD